MNAPGGKTTNDRSNGQMMIAVEGALDPHALNGIEAWAAACSVVSDAIRSEDTRSQHDR